MSSKFASLIPKLQVLPPEIRYVSSGGLKYYERVLEAQQAITERRPSELIRIYGGLRAEIAVKEAELKALELRLEAVSGVMVESYRQEAITDLTITGVGNVRTDPVPYSHVFDRDQYREWCLGNGFGPQMALPWQTTNSTVKELLLTGEEPPPGVSVYLKWTPVFTKEK